MVSYDHYSTPGLAERFATTATVGQTIADFRLKISNDLYDREVTPDYVKAQMYGGFALSDVKEVHVPDGEELSEALKKRLAEAGVRMVRKPKPMRQLYSFYRYFPWDQK
jgi:hypothetical protein